MMNVRLLLLILILPACTGERVARRSPVQPTRQFTPVSNAREVSQPRSPSGRFVRERVYLITRRDTSNEPVGSWRALGETISQNGSNIEFVDQSTGRTISFNDSHDIEPQDSMTGRPAVEFNSEGSARAEAPPAPVQ